MFKVILNMTGDKSSTFAFYAAKSSVSKEVNLNNSRIQGTNFIIINLDP